MRVRKIIERYVSRSHCVDHFAKSLFLSARSVCVCAYVCVSLGPARSDRYSSHYIERFLRVFACSPLVCFAICDSAPCPLCRCVPAFISLSLLLHCDRSRLFGALCQRFGVSEILLEINMLDCLMIAQFFIRAYSIC